MSHLDYFPQDYRSGRTAFLAAAEKAGAEIATYEAGSSGPDGAPVSTDVALLGRADAPNVFLCNTATHGVEGFCGSGILTGFLDSGETAALPENVRLVFIHALNCHGFAWLRRVTEENVDLNRNFVDHTKKHPKNAEYTDKRNKHKFNNEKIYRKLIKERGFTWAKNIYWSNTKAPFSAHNPEWTISAALEFVEEHKDQPCQGDPNFPLELARKDVFSKIRLPEQNDKMSL